MQLLEESPREWDAMTLMLKLICDDRRLSEVAEELNGAGYRRRDGSEWTQVAIFSLLPRLIEIGPRVYTSDEWLAQKPFLQKIG